MVNQDTLVTTDTCNANAVQPMKRILLSEIDVSWHPLVREAVAAAQRWKRQKATGGNRRLSLVLAAAYRDERATGKGVGKTHMLKALLHCNCYTVDGVPVGFTGRFYEAKKLIRLVKNTNPGGLFGDADVIAIDDVGTEGTLPYIAADMQGHEIAMRYYSIVNWCYERQRGLLVSTNLTLDRDGGEFGRYIGPRAWSRLQQMAPPGLMVDLTGVPDYRLKLSGRLAS